MNDPPHEAILIGYAASLPFFNILGNEVALSFVIQPNSSTANAAFSTGGQDSTTVSYVGNIVALVRFDEGSLQASHIKFTGESIQIQDTE